MPMFLAAAAIDASGARADSANGGALAVLVLIVVALAWVGLRALLRRLRVGKTEGIVHGAFPEFALQALANAARLDGRVADAERAAIKSAMRELAGAEFDVASVDAALNAANLSKDELVDYLTSSAARFTTAQKTALLKALLGVFVADGRFDETEHQALVEYTAAIGFDRASAPGRLRGLLSDMARDRII